MVRSMPSKLRWRVAGWVAGSFRIYYHWATGTRTLSLYQALQTDTLKWNVRCPHCRRIIWQDNLNWNVRCLLLFLKHLRILCGVPTLIWTSDQMSQIGMCGVPSPPNFQTSFQFGCQSSSTCISKWGTPNWDCHWFYCQLLFYSQLDIS